MVCTSMVFQDVREEQNHYRMAAVEREQMVKQTLDTRQIWNLEYIDMKESKELRKLTFSMLDENYRWMG